MPPIWRRLLVPGELWSEQHRADSRCGQALYCWYRPRWRRREQLRRMFCVKGLNLQSCPRHTRCVRRFF